MVTTFVATCAATLAWLAVEKFKDGHVTGVGAASGAVTGLVAITPACGAVTPVGAIAVGAIAGAICIYAVGLKSKFGYDDSLDVVGVHMVGGVVGTLLIGFFASDGMPSAVSGLFYGGGFDQLWRQAVAAGAVLVYSFVVSFIIALAIKKTMGIRISPEEEQKGIDAHIHRDSAYELEYA
jgi:Amt family ammonium transporter